LQLVIACYIIVIEIQGHKKNRKKKEGLKMKVNRNEERKILRAKCVKAPAQAVENKFYDLQDDTEQLATEYTGICLKELLKKEKFDYIEQDHIRKGKSGKPEVKVNAGSKMEYLIARDILELPNHIVDATSGIDVLRYGWSYEIKTLTSNSGCAGYNGLQGWVDVFTGSRKQLLIAIDNQVYQMSGKTLISILPQITWKDKNKAKWRISGVRANYELIAQYGTLIDTVDLSQ